jgi:hypothetical protein
MWETPIYKFNAKEKGKKKTIYIDVTGSAPPFSVPGKQLESTFRNLLKGLSPKKTKILDFGAAKLRNTIYLLEEGYTVYSCEFQDLFKRSKQAAEYLAKAKKYNNFKQLIFPKEFIEFGGRFDVVLLINVLNIMPIALERLAVLALCREKIVSDGRLLWYTQHGAYSMERDAIKVCDGIATGKGRKYMMFYRDFSRKDIHDMLNSTGFSYDNDFKFPTSGNNQAYVFRPHGPVLVDQSLGLKGMLGYKRRLEEITRKIPKRRYKTKAPRDVIKTKSVNIDKQYLEELKGIPPGRAKKRASKYHNLIFNILKFVFNDSLSKPKKEDQWDDKTQRVDITFKNLREKGFFKQLAEGYNITCPNIFIECKNYSKDVANPEFSQIHNRLNNIRGQFGIIVCRKIRDSQKIKTRQTTLAKDNKYVIVLDDSCIKKIVEFKIKNEDSQIDDYLEEKFKELI